MSGGRFDYKQYHIGGIADEVERIIKEANTEVWNTYSEDTITELKAGLAVLRVAEIYAQRIDWLVSGDDSEKSFHERLQEDLDKM